MGTRGKEIGGGRIRKRNRGGKNKRREGKKGGENGVKRG